MKTGVLLMSLGSPDTLDDMESYLLEVRNGRKPSPEFTADIKERYRKAGGRSPLLDIARKQASALEKSLGKNFKTYVGMRHWHPYIHEVMKEIAVDGIETLVSLPLTPYYSSMSTKAYHEKVMEARQKLNLNFTVINVNDWHDHPLLIETFVDLVNSGFAKFPGIPRTEVKVLFTAHSLPERILKQNDPYPFQVRETARLVADKAKIESWEFAFQSQGGSQEPWLGPKVEDVLEKGISPLLIAPIGFVCDHLEILYDIDILFKEIAREKAIHLERTPSANDHPKFIETLKSVVLENLNAPASAARK